MKVIVTVKPVNEIYDFLRIGIFPAILEFSFYMLEAWQPHCIRNHFFPKFTVSGQTVTLNCSFVIPQEIKDDFLFSGTILIEKINQSQVMSHGHPHITFLDVQTIFAGFLHEYLGRHLLNIRHLMTYRAI